MAYPTSVNDQITDSVTQSNVKVVGEAPAMAMGSLYQAMSHATGVMFENAVSAQQQMNVAAEAATTLAVSTLLKTNT
nr:RebB family R body protein [Kordiimonas aestuarii]